MVTGVSANSRDGGREKERRRGMEKEREKGGPGRI